MPWEAWDCRAELVRLDALHFGGNKQPERQARSERGYGEYRGLRGSSRRIDYPAYFRADFPGLGYPSDRLPHQWFSLCRQAGLNGVRSLPHDMSSIGSHVWECKIISP